MKGLVLANALSNIDFDLLTSDNVRHYRGCWGEVLEVKCGNNVLAVFIDEENQGCARLYQTDGFGNYEKTDEISVTQENLEKVMRDGINKAKEGA